MTKRAKRWSIAALAAAFSALAAFAVDHYLHRERGSARLHIDTSASTPTSAPSSVSGSGEVGALDASASGSTPRFPPSSFRRQPWDPADFPQAQGARGPLRVDEWSGFAYSPNLDFERVWSEHEGGRWRVRTNSLGLRNDDEPSAARPDLRLLVVGDSHTAGFCNNAESYAQLAAARLAKARGERVEALNAAVPGFSFFHYLGALERLLPLEPDVLVVGVYGGNDFSEVLGLQHRYQGTPRGDLAALEARLAGANELDPDAVSQCFFAYLQFDADPAQIEVALQAARDVTTEIQVTCLRHALALVVVYLPPPTDVAWQRRAQHYDELARSLGLDREGCRVLDRMADSYLAFLRARGIATVDMRPEFRAAREALYWEGDSHLAPAGHALVAAALAQAVDELLPRGAKRVRPAAPSASEERALLSPGYGSTGPGSHERER